MRHVFDTSSVRKLSSLTGREWQTFRKAFRRAGYTSGWIPRVLGAELMGSNLHRKELTVEGLRDLQLAVSRMNNLAASEVLPDDIELATRSVYSMAGIEYPQDAYRTDKEEWPRYIRKFLSVRSPEQVSSRAQDGRLYVTIKDEHGGGTLTI